MNWRPYPAERPPEDVDLLITWRGQEGAKQVQFTKRGERMQFGHPDVGGFRSYIDPDYWCVVEPPA